MRKILLTLLTTLLCSVTAWGATTLNKAPLSWGELGSLPSDQVSATNLTLKYDGNTNFGSGTPAAVVGSDGTINQSSTTNLGSGAKMLRNNKETGNTSSLFLQAASGYYLASVTLVFAPNTTAGSDQSVTNFVKIYTEYGILEARQINSISGLYFGSSGIQSGGTATTTSNWDTHNAAGFDVKTNHTSKTAPKVTSITINLKDTSTVSKIAIASVSSKNYAYITGYRVSLKSASSCAATVPGNISKGSACAGDDLTLTSAGSPASGDTWYWQASSSGTATTNSGATYDVSSAGTYYIRSYNGTCWSAAKSVTVAAGDWTSPTISGASSVTVGNTITLTGSPSGGSWESSDETKATVNSSGVVSGVAIGNTNITYSKDGCTSTDHAVTVSAACTDPSLTIKLN